MIHDNRSAQEYLRSVLEKGLREQQATTSSTQAQTASTGRTSHSKTKNSTSSDTHAHATTKQQTTNSTQARTVPTGRASHSKTKNSTSSDTHARATTKLDEKSQIELAYDKRFIELLEGGYDLNSPQMQQLFESKAKELANLIANQEKTTNTNIQTNNSNNIASQPANTQTEKSTSVASQPANNQTVSKKAHIIIDKGRYFLLEPNKLNVIDSRESNPITNIFTRRHNLKLFKRQLDADFENYKKYCAHSKQPIDEKFVEMHDRMKYYLKLCPDADYNILELIRKNSKYIDPSYENYQAICAEYLYQLAILDYANSDNMPFDIWFSTYEPVVSDHKYISYQFTGEKHPVENFRKIYWQSHERPTTLDEYRCKVPFEEYNPTFTGLKHVKTNDAPSR